MPGAGCHNPLISTGAGGSCGRCGALRTPTHSPPGSSAKLGALRNERAAQRVAFQPAFENAVEDEALEVAAIDNDRHSVACDRNVNGTAFDVSRPFAGVVMKRQHADDARSLSGQLEHPFPSQVFICRGVRANQNGCERDAVSNVHLSRVPSASSTQMMCINLRSGSFALKP